MANAQAIRHLEERNVVSRLLIVLLIFFQLDVFGNRFERTPLSEKISAQSVFRNLPNTPQKKACDLNLFQDRQERLIFFSQRMIAFHQELTAQLKQKILLMSERKSLLNRSILSVRRAQKQLRARMLSSQGWAKTRKMMHKIRNEVTESTQSLEAQSIHAEEIIHIFRSFVEGIDTWKKTEILSLSECHGKRARGLYKMVLGSTDQILKDGHRLVNQFERLNNPFQVKAH